MNLSVDTQAERAGTKEAYFERTAASRFRPTHHVGGGWNPQEQHIAPVLGLLAHAVERDRDARRSDGLALARLSCDILGVLPMEEIEIEVRVLRPGKTIELVEACVTHGGRAAVLMRAWLMQGGDTSAFAGSPLSAIPGPDEMERWNISGVWPGGFVRSVDIRRREESPGRAMFWLGTGVVLISGEQVSPTARAIGLIDIANGITPRLPPETMAFPNIDLTVHLLGAPHNGWLGFDTHVNFGDTGIGITHSILHDLRGPVGIVSQSLTLRPRPA